MTQLTDLGQVLGGLPPTALVGLLIVGVFVVALIMAWRQS